MVLNYSVCIGTTCYPHSMDNNNLAISSLSPIIQQVNVDPNTDRANGHKMVASSSHLQ